jgi:tetratricopeptide (TPR) repeat protein
MHLSSSLQLIYAVILGLLLWFSADMRSIVKAMQLKNRLSIDGRWDELEKYFQRASKSYRPFVWIHRRYLLPGNIPVQHALFLFKQGRLEEALAKADEAIRLIERKPIICRHIYGSGTFKIWSGALRARTLILGGLGRYDEAREAAAKLQRRTRSGAGANSSLALLEYNCGHLDEALAQSKSVPPENPQYDSMRAIAALVLSMKGEFDEAIQTLMFEPAEVTKFYSPENWEMVHGTTDGARFIELQRQKMAGVFQPARLLALAQVYLAREDFENAVRALDQAEKVLGPEPGIQFSYCRHRACSLAAQGKADEAGKYIERMRAMAKQRPKRSLLWETHFSTGRAYLYLGRFDDALSELNEAQRSVLHPIEKHVTAYYFAKSHEAAGRLEEAMPYYRTVATDPIPSWMQKRAAEFLAQQNTNS